ncbi:MAG: hypothetical protein M3Y41_02645 [Pseudomonadota bacterium]|nr:hypothetical protein [Pseudomonadota bacterium]
MASVPDPARLRRGPPLGGEIPSPANPPPGCTFHARCPMAVERCRREVPGWRELGESWVACHRAEKAAA